MTGPRLRNPVDDLLGDTEPVRVREARKRAALGRVRDAQADAEGALATGLRSFAGGIVDVGKRFTRGAAQLVGDVADTVDSDVGQRFASALDREAAALGRYNAGVLPSAENQGRNPLSAATGATIGEAAPEFALGELAAAPARVLTRGVSRAIPALAPELGPGVSGRPVREAAKAVARGIVPQAATQTAAFAPLNPDEPVSPTGLAFSALGTLGEATAGYNAGRFAQARDAEGADAAFARALDAAKERAAPYRAQNQALTQDIQGRQAAWDAKIAALPEEPRSFRRPGGQVDESNLARPLTDEAPVTTNTTREAVNAVDALLEPARVAPKADVAPVAETPFPEGYSTKSMETTRRPRSYLLADEPAPVVEPVAAPAKAPPITDPSLAEVPPTWQMPDLAPPRIVPESLVAPQQGPLRTQAQIEATVTPPAGIPRVEPQVETPVQSEPVSFGRDLAEPPRIPEEVKVPRRPQGTDPLVNTLDETASVGAVPSRIPGEIPPPVRVAPELPVPEGTPKNVPAEALVNREKIGLTSPEQEAELTTALERAKAKGVDRERISTPEQERVARQAFEDHLRFSLHEVDPAKASRMSGAEIGQLYENVSNNVAQTVALSRELLNPDLTTAQRDQMTAVLTKLRGENDNLLGNIVKGTAQKGRDLNYLRQIAQQTTDPGVWLLHAKRALGDTPMNDEVQSTIVRLANEAQSVCG